MFIAAAVALGLGRLRPCLYGLRHGGASEDLLTKARTVLDVKTRGRWSSDSSLKRYGKQTRLLSELQKVPQEVLHYGEQMARLPPSIFLHSHPAPAPPVLAAQALED